MGFLTLIGLLLIATLLMSMMAQAHPWRKIEIPGRVIETQPIRLMQRVMFHRSSLLALGMGILIGRVSGWLPASIAIYTAALALAILLVPMRYIFTTQGVAVGQAIFRPWKEFSSIQKKPNQIILEHPSFFRRLTLFVKPVEIEKVLAVIEKSYQ